MGIGSNAHICVMAKKALVTLLAILYLGVSTGATLHFQYCMGQLVKISLGHNDDEKCHTCGMAKAEAYSKDCCTDSHQHLKADKSSAASAQHFTLASPVIFLDRQFAITGAFLPVAVNRVPAAAHGPPLGSHIPAFIRYHNFRI